MVMRTGLKDLPARPVGANLPPWDKFYKDWAIEPKANGWRGWFNQKTGIGYNRAGQIASNAKLMQERFAHCKIKSPWIDCELMGMRESVGRETIIVIDCFDPDNPKPYKQRVREFYFLQPAPFELRPFSLYRMPRFSHKDLKAVWAEMDFQNRNCLVWEGFVMKKDERYPAIQNPNWCSLNWHKWRIK